MASSCPSYFCLFFKGQSVFLYFIGSKNWSTWIASWKLPIEQNQNVLKLLKKGLKIVFNLLLSPLPVNFLLTFPIEHLFLSDGILSQYHLSALVATSILSCLFNWISRWMILQLQDLLTKDFCQLFLALVYLNWKVSWKEKNNVQLMIVYMYLIRNSLNEKVMLMS